MDTTSARRQTPELPGYPIYLSQIMLVCTYGLVALLYLTLLMFTGWIEGASRAHLRVSALQWIFATPFGPPLVICGVAALVGLPLFLVPHREWLRPYLVHLEDVTGRPAAEWPSRSALLTREERARRWLGAERRERRVSLLLLVSAALLALGLLALVIAAEVRFGPGLFAADHPTDDAAPVQFLPIFAASGMFLVLAVLFAFLVAMFRRLERRCGVWLRSSRRYYTGTACYIRRPGTSPEAARACLAAYTATPEPPLARSTALVIVAATPLLVAFFGGEFLGVWLRLHRLN